VPRTEEIRHHHDLLLLLFVSMPTGLLTEKADGIYVISFPTCQSGSTSWVLLCQSATVIADREMVMRLLLGPMTTSSEHVVVDVALHM
jgi:hypothetical protein